LGIRHIGIENAKIIADNIKNISNFIDIIKTENFEKFLNIDGIGQTQINSLKNYFSNKLNVNITIELKSILKIEENLPNESGLLKDKSFMFTGKLSGISRAEAKSLVEKNSGITLSAVSKNLDFLVIGDKPTKRKIDQANDFGIKIIKLNELKKLLDQIN
jgi:DNA ligase (NAD+)